MAKESDEERKAKIRAELEDRARARATITYGEAATLVGLANQGLAPILNAIREEETEQGRPDLGCIVVRSDTGFPSYVGTGEDDRARALSTRKAVFASWRRRKL